MGRPHVSNMDDTMSYPDPTGVRLPLPLAGRQYCGDLNIRIGHDGSWYYNAKRIDQPEMISLFASFLTRDDDGAYWLVTPTEMGRREPAQAIEMPRIPGSLPIGRKLDKARPEYSGQFPREPCYFVGTDETAQSISLRTNIGQIITLGETAALVDRPCPATREPTTYAIVDNTIEVLLDKSVYNHLLELSEKVMRDGKVVRGVYSEGTFFPLTHHTG